ncbi:hypothetical protein T439DRAFT_106954 [Meredithblackwellia eburnea MCA 4105]
MSLLVPTTILPDSLAFYLSADIFFELFLALIPLVKIPVCGVTVDQTSMTPRGRNNWWTMSLGEANIYSYIFSVCITATSGSLNLSTFNFFQLQYHLS